MAMTTKTMHKTAISATISFLYYNPSAFFWQDRNEFLTFFSCKFFIFSEIFSDEMRDNCVGMPLDIQWSNVKFREFN